ncbi:hypothetical protein, partial [Escherichia coli]|uniref:hypothetical protein n=1 Tax=Escherichia coli TaxID=562 RepID=UPI0019547DC4
EGLRSEALAGLRQGGGGVDQVHGAKLSILMNISTDSFKPVTLLCKMSQYAGQSILQAIPGFGAVVEHNDVSGFAVV